MVCWSEAALRKRRRLRAKPDRPHRRRRTQPRQPRPQRKKQERPRLERFESLSWTSARPVSLPRLQQAIGRLAPRLARAKGLFETTERPGRQLLFQLAGGRATLVPAGAPPPDLPRARIVFIAETGALSQAEIDEAMDPCVAP